MRRTRTGPLVATLPQEAPRLAAPSRRGASRSRRLRQSSAEGLRLIQGSLAARPVERQAPWLAGLHRLASGTLVGLGVSMLGLSALTLHWQNRWAVSYTDLEATKALEHRLQESAAVLEQHHLGMTRKPALLEPTSSQKLVYLEPPTTNEQPRLSALLAQVNPRQILPGY